jgi:putative inorganic carbon (HCO3(-)) transporter
MPASRSSGSTLTSPAAGSVRWLWAGIGVGLLFLLLTQLDAQWFVFLFIGGLVFVAALGASDRKTYYLVLLVLVLSVGIDLNLAYRPSAYRRLSYGFAIHLTYLPLAALYLIWLARAFAERDALQLSTTGLLPVTILFLAGLVSLDNVRDARFGLFTIFSLAMSVLLFMYAASTIRTVQELRVVVLALMGVLILQGLIALGQHATNSTLGLGFFGSGETLRGGAGLQVLTRVGGTLGHPNSLAMFLELLLPLGVSLLLSPLDRQIKLVAGLATVFGGIGLVTTLSRGGLMATGFGVMLVLWNRWTAAIGLVRTGLALTLAIVLLTGALFVVPNPVRTRIIEHDYGNAYGRIPNMEVAFNIIRDRSLFGVGLNNYTEAARAYDHTPEQIVALWNAPVHNLFLFIAGEIGLVGLAGFLLLLIGTVRAVLPALRSPEPLVAAAALGLVAGLMAFLLHSQVDYTSWPLFDTLWFLLGLSVALGRLSAALWILPAEER